MSENDDHTVTEPDGSEYTWRDRMVGERMAVDQEFSPRIVNSDFTNQEWGMIMTAVRFEIDRATDPENARLVADTSQVKHIVPELEKLQQASMGMPDGSTGGGRGRSGSGGFLGSIKSALGFGGDGGADVDDVVSRADTLTGEYAEKLQTRLEENGKWESIRVEAAATKDTEQTETENGNE